MWGSESGTKQQQGWWFTWLEVNSDYTLHQNCFHKGKRMGHGHGRFPSEGNRGPNTLIDSFLGIVCCLLGAWVKDVKRKLFTMIQLYGSLSITDFSGRQQWSPNKKSMGNQETSKPWDGWLRDQEEKECSPLSFQLQELMKEEPED